jgi:hypothetical protein
MNTVLIFNGLGNQMSQYAFYLAKKRYNPNIVCLYFPCKYDDQHNGFELKKVFNIRIHKNLKYYIAHWLYFIYSNKDVKGFQGKISRRISKHLKINIIHESSYSFNKEFLLDKYTGISYFWGGWHNERYYDAIKADLRKIYSFKISNNDYLTLKLQQEICSKTSISVHIRRGDYLNNKIVDVFGRICDLEYYQRAIEYIKSNVENPFFYVFSDDKEWIKANLSFPNSQIVDFNHGKDSWKDMYLMSLCKHNINANSTFSWWAAWLNNNEHKIIVVPEQFNVHGGSDIYPPSWIKIPLYSKHK